MLGMVLDGLVGSRGALRIIIYDYDSRRRGGREVGPGGQHVRAQTIKDQGPCPSMNEHPRRDTDVILRQPEKCRGGRA